MIAYLRNTSDKEIGHFLFENFSLTDTNRSDMPSNTVKFRRKIDSSNSWTKTFSSSGLTFVGQLSSLWSLFLTGEPPVSNCCLCKFVIKIREVSKESILNKKFENCFVDHKSKLGLKSNERHNFVSVFPSKNVQYSGGFRIPMVCSVLRH